MIILKNKGYTLGIHIEFFSKNRSLLGIFFQRGIECLENLDNQIVDFNELSIGVIFIYFRIVKYTEHNEYND